MTRINVVPVGELCDQHLLAEHRELTRIPNAIAAGKLSDTSKIPSEYKLGTGHVYFFADKLSYLLTRYQSIRKELYERGFKNEDRWDYDSGYAWNSNHSWRWNGYSPTPEALALNRQRIKERWPKNARYHRVPIDGPETLIVR